MVAAIGEEKWLLQLQQFLMLYCIINDLHLRVHFYNFLYDMSKCT